MVSGINICLYTCLALNIMLACNIIHSTMGRSYTNINVHIIFHTKENMCVMNEEDLTEIFRYIGGMVRTLSGYAFIVGGRPDHIHLLASIPLTMSLSDFVGKIKSNTSRWIKGLNAQYKDFTWQEGYGAFSVSESNKEQVLKYILSQKEHHRKYTAHEEFIHFLEKNHLPPERYLQGQNTPEQ